MVGCFAAKTSRNVFDFIGTGAAPFVIAPPVILIYGIYLDDGFLSTVITVLVGAYMLYKCASMMTTFNIEHGASTVDVIVASFGRRGALVCALVICGACMNWLLWQIRFCTQIFHNSYVLSDFIFPTLLGKKFFTLMTFLCLLPSFLKTNHNVFMTRIVIPLLFISFFIVVFASPHKNIETYTFTTKQNINFSNISIFFNSWLLHALGVHSLYSGQSLTPRSQRIIAFLFLIVLPLVCGIVILRGVDHPLSGDIDWLTKNIGAFPITYAIYIFCGGLSISYINIFYCADILSSLFNFRSRSQLASLLGVATYLFIGTTYEIENTFGPVELFNIVTVSTVVIIALQTTSNAHILHSNIILQKRNRLALFLATLVGLVTQTGYVSITGEPSFDAGLAAFALSTYYSRSRFRNPKPREPERPYTSF